MKCLWGPLAAVCLLVSPVSADTVILKNGTRIDGVVVRRDQHSVKIKHYMGAGRVTTIYPLKEIERLFIDGEANREALDQYRSDVQVFREESETGEDDPGGGPGLECWLNKKLREEHRRKREREKQEKKTAARLERDRKAREAAAARWEEQKFQEDFDREFEEERESLRFGFINEKVNRETGFRSYEGEVYNDGVHTKENVAIRMDFYDHQGDYFATGKAATEPDVIAPGGKASFEVFIYNPELRGMEYKTLATWDYREDEEGEH